MCKTMTAKNGGFILLAVLWVTALLSMFALNYATSARMSGLAVRLSRDLADNQLLLRSALERGRHEYMKYTANKGLLEDKELVEWITDEPLELLYPRHESYRVFLDETEVDLRVVADSGRLNINGISAAMLERILIACGIPQGQRMTEVTNSILDWIDPDDLHRAEGAESDYYLGLDRPYYAKNNALESLEELLLIRGVDAALYNGSDGRPGLVDFLGVSGQNEKFDINNASPRVFAIINEFPEDAVEEILRLREDRPIASLDILADVVPQAYYSQFVELFGVVETTIVRVQAALVNEDGTPGRMVELVLEE